MTRGARIVYLMYHELEMPGRRMCQDEPGYVRYVLAETDFRAQIQDLYARRNQGMSVGEALRSPHANGVVLTFDDGCETDLIVAAPLLAELSFNATFYITVGFLDRPGYLSRGQLRELAALGFEIGSHSVTHPYLNDLSDSSLRHEIEDSKTMLEQIIGRPVLHFSCPGGRRDKRTVSAAREAGYISLATSETKTNTPSTNSFALGRVAMLRGTSLSEFQKISAGHGIWKRHTKESVRLLVRNLVGNSLYDKLRSVLLQRG